MSRKVRKTSFFSLSSLDGVETAVGQVIVLLGAEFKPDKRIGLRLVCAGWAKVLRPPTLVYMEPELSKYLEVMWPSGIRDKDHHLDLVIECARRRTLTAVRDLVRRIFARRLFLRITPEHRVGLIATSHALIAATHGHTMEGRNLVDCVHDLICCCPDRRAYVRKEHHVGHITHTKEEADNCVFHTEDVIDSLAAMGDTRAVSKYAEGHWHFEDQETHVALIAAKHRHLDLLRWINAESCAGLYRLDDVNRALLSCPMVWQEMCWIVPGWAEASEILNWKCAEEHILATISSGDMGRAEEVIGAWTEEYDEEINERLDEGFGCDCYIAAIESGSVAMLEFVVAQLSVLRRRILRHDLQFAVGECCIDLCSETWYFEKKSRVDVCAVLEALPGLAKLDEPLVVDFAGLDMVKGMRFDVYMATRKMDVRLSPKTRREMWDSLDTAQRMQLPPNFCEM